MEEQDVLTGDSSFNAHFGECITAIGDIDDDGYQGQFQFNYFSSDQLLGKLSRIQLISNGFYNRTIRLSTR